MNTEIWCVIPVFNNKDTVYDVAIACRAKMPHVLVVDDGSTDCDISDMFAQEDISVLKHDTNQGKGVAILTALQFVHKQAGTHIITIDADGQHYPDDIDSFIHAIEKDGESLIVGVRKFEQDTIPHSSRIGRMIANFWMLVETGITMRDCQSGFRAYPVDILLALSLHGAHYDFETEVISRAAWAGLTIHEVEIGVWYPLKEKRVSHFHPFKDNFRISCMHTRLVGRRILPVPHKKLVQKKTKKIDLHILKHPITLLKKLLHENATPLGLATSAGVGIILAVLPLLSVHTIAIIYVTTRLHLNKIMAISIQHICMPPLVPLICIELGYYMRYGHWLTDISIDAVFGHIHLRLFDWFIGSLIVAPILAILVAGVVFLAATHLQKKRTLCDG